MKEIFEEMAGTCHIRPQPGPHAGKSSTSKMERDIFGDEAVDDALPSEFETMSAEGIGQRARLLENELRVLKDEGTRLTLETNNLKEKIKENKVSRA